jgi:hypothetical protein
MRRIRVDDPDHHGEVVFEVLEGVRGEQHIVVISEQEKDLGEPGEKNRELSANR